MTDDRELLRRFVQQRDEPAFAELVQRHVNLVFSAALRQTRGDAHRAEEVTQMVFIDLARKAPTLVDRSVLSGWLFLSAGYAAANLARTDRRRIAREQEAYTMNELCGTAGDDTAWQKVRPEIDAVMRDLHERDREAVLLRFFEGQSFPEIGTRLSLSENAARMRVERALEKLQGLLARRGITSTATALATVLTSQAVGAAPVGLAAAATTSALASAAVASGAATAIPLLAMNKLAFVSLAGLALAAGALVFFQHQANVQYRAETAALLQQQGREIAQLRTANEKLSNLKAAAAGQAALTASERAELERLRTAKAATPARLVKDPNPPVMLQAPLTPVTNAGTGTPLAAFQTLAWSVNQSDPDTLASVVEFSPVGRERLNALWARLPESTRTQIGSPEKIFANIMAAKVKPPQEVGVISETAQGDDAVLLEVTDGKRWRDKFNLHRTNGSWKIVAPDEAVETYLRSLTQTAERKP